MIFTSDDYITKYQDTLSYILERAVFEKYSLDYIEKTIAYSKPFLEFEKSNITQIAFSSQEYIYHELFPLKDNDDFYADYYGPFGWAGFMYIKLFFDLRITFETLFIIFPIEKMLASYHLYHEMEYSQLLRYVKSLIAFSYLNMIMKKKNISSNDLSNNTGISMSTINALRYEKRDINKVEANKLLKMSSALNVRMESLLTDIALEFDS